MIPKNYHLNSRKYNGIFGLHRFYVKRYQSAVLYLFTAGFFIIGAIYDFIMIFSGRFTDCYNQPVSCWDGFRHIDPKNPNLPICSRCNHDVFAYKTVHAIEKVLQMKSSTENADDAKRIKEILEFKKTLANTEGEATNEVCLNFILIYLDKYLIFFFIVKNINTLL